MPLPPESWTNYGNLCGDSLVVASRALSPAWSAGPSSDAAEPVGPRRKRAAREETSRRGHRDAGLSGLMAARELVKAGLENIRVVEARDRVGGLNVRMDCQGPHEHARPHPGVRARDAQRGRLLRLA